MKQPTENYFIKTYEEPVTIEGEISYSFDTKIENKVIKSFCLSNWTCSELFIQDNAYSFYKGASFEKVPYTLSKDEQSGLLQSAINGDVLVLRYVDKIMIINIWSNTSYELTVRATKLLLTQKSFYIHIDRNNIIVEYDFSGNEIEVRNVKGEFIDMSYRGFLYVLSSNKNKYHILKENTEVESEYLSAISTDRTMITEFSMLQNSDFIVCEEANRVYYIDNVKNKKELFFDKSVSSIETDCKGRVLILSENKIYRFIREVKYKTAKVFYVKFNSFKNNTLWHSVVMDADIPTGTKVEVLIDCDDRPTKRHINTEKFENSSPVYINTKEILLNNEKGKKLLAKVTLYSDSLQEKTPKVNSIKSLFDKTSYLEYLPNCYKEDSETLYKFLAIFQNIMDEISTTIETVPQMLDIATTDEEFITWLSQWLGIVRDYRWPQERYREFLRNVTTLYTKAGTKAGLKKIIELYSGYIPEIIEFADEADNPFFFCVKIDADLTEMEVSVIKAIVDEFKPAHTVAKVVVDNSKKDNLNLVLDESVLAFSSRI